MNKAPETIPVAVSLFSVRAGDVDLSDVTNSATATLRVGTNRIDDKVSFKFEHRARPKRWHRVWRKLFGRYRRLPWYGTPPDDYNVAVDGVVIAAEGWAVNVWFDQRRAGLMAGDTLDINLAIDLRASVARNGFGTVH